MKNRVIIIVLFLVAGVSFVSLSQNNSDNKLVQFSGIVIERDSLIPVPFTQILVQGTRRGTFSDYFGYFSFVAAKGDTIVFSAVGFKNSYFIIPDTLKTNRYSLIQIIAMDTIYLKEAVIYPWPTKDQFKQAFLSLNAPNDMYDNANKNLNKDIMQLQYQNMGNDANLAYKAAMQQQYSRLYYAGQLPPNNLLNPIAWAKFIDAWKKGQFKNNNNNNKSYDD